MPKTSRESAQVAQYGPVEDRRTDLGDYTIEFVSFTADTDATELLRGLPGDACTSPHWGYVFTGKMTFRTADGGEEVFGPGDAFYLPPGHVPMVTAGTEYLQISPSDEVRVVSEHMMRRMAGSGRD